MIDLLPQTIRLELQTDELHRTYVIEIWSLPEGGHRGHQVQEVQEDPEDQEQGRQSAGGRSYRDHRDRAFPCSEEGEERDGKGCRRPSCSEIDPSSGEHGSCQ